MSQRSMAPPSCTLTSDTVGSPSPVATINFADSLLNVVADPIFVKDRNHRLVLVNDAFCVFIGKKREELLKKSDHEMFPKAEADVFYDRDERVFFTERENVNEEVITDGQGIVHTIVTKKTIYKDRDGIPYIVGIIRDITAQKVAEERLKVLNINLETRVRERTAAIEEQSVELTRSNAELERFAYIASHDLQEPLRMVASYVQLLQRRYKDKLDKDANDFIAFAVDGVTRMKALINDLLEYSRLGKKASDLKPIDVNAVVQQVLATMSLTIKESDAVITWTDFPVVTADPLQLGRVLQNLIGNALKFRSQQPPRIHIAGVLKDAWGIFSVCDNGIGIEPQHRDRIFDIFQRLHTSDKYPGTGIGLAVCKRIVERHGGRIWVESTLGQGATFYFTLPVPPINL